MTNLSLINRIVRLTFGMLLLTWTLAGGAWWGVFGIYLIASGAWGYSPLLAYRNRRRIDR